MAFIYDKDKAYACGLGGNEDGSVSVTIGYECDVIADVETFSFEFKDSSLTVRCSKELAAEIASAFAAVAEG